MPSQCAISSSQESKDQQDSLECIKTKATGGAEQKPAQFGEAGGLGGEGLRTWGGEKRGRKSVGLADAGGPTST